jgi:iron-sulfur cluster assembly accessory protein
MLTLTETASLKLKEILAQQTEPAIGLRVHVLPGGCSGYSYGMSIAEKAEATDWIGEFGGVKVLVDPTSAPLLEGAAIDYRETLQSSGFTITNPNAVRSCGCGNSFHTEEEAPAAEPAAKAHGGGCGTDGCGCGGH